MTTREDVTVDFQPSPRIAEVASPSVTINMQDVVDTLRKREDVFIDGMANTKLMNASGKESLGGGVSVGITVALQDTQIAFEARTTPAETGTVTTGSSTPINGTIVFEDTGADFDAASIVRGSMVINFTDNSIADVIEVVNSTTLKTKTLVNGIGNTYDTSDVYQVFNVIQCELDGGNLVAVDDLDSAISPVLPTAFTQIVRTASSSATLLSTNAQDFVDTLMAQLIDGVSFNDVMEKLLAMATGRIVESSSGVFDFYEQDNSTVLFTLTKAGSERNRS